MIAPPMMPTSPRMMLIARSPGSAIPLTSWMTPLTTHQMPMTHAAVSTDCPGRTSRMSPATTVSAPSRTSTTRHTVEAPGSPAMPRRMLIVPQKMR